MCRRRWAMRCAPAALLLAAAAAASPPKEGALQIVHKQYSIKPRIQLFYPSGGAGGYPPDGAYPVVVYAHGLMGGHVDIIGYTTLFERIASFGFVVVAPMDSIEGVGDVATIIDFVRAPPAGAEWANAVNVSAGVGIVGHSMGGGTVGPAATQPHASALNIRAAMFHHCPCEFPFSAGVQPADVAVPVALFTGTTDIICMARFARKFYEGITFAPRTFRNQVGMNHLEPVLEGLGNNENPYLGYFTAAWFKVYLVGDRGEFYDHIYNETSQDSLCGYAKMKQCENVLPTGPAPTPPALKYACTGSQCTSSPDGVDLQTCTAACS